MILKIKHNYTFINYKSIDYIDRNNTVKRVYSNVLDFLTKKCDLSQKLLRIIQRGCPINNSF